MDFRKITEQQVSQKRSKLAYKNNATKNSKELQYCVLTFHTVFQSSAKGLSFLLLLTLETTISRKQSLSSYTDKSLTPGTAPSTRFCTQYFLNQWKDGKRKQVRLTNLKKSELLDILAKNVNYKSRLQEWAV